MTALFMGSLVIFSGQALAMKSNKQELTNAEALNDSEVAIAQQDTERLCAQVQVGVAILDRIITRLEQVEKQVEIQQLKEIPPEFRAEIVNSLKQVINSIAEFQILAEQDKDSQLLITITTVIGVLDNVAEAIAKGQVGQAVRLKGVKAEAERVFINYCKQDTRSRREKLFHKIKC